MLIPSGATGTTNPGPAASASQPNQPAGTQPQQAPAAQPPTTTQPAPGPAAQPSDVFHGVPAGTTWEQFAAANPGFTPEMVAKMKRDMQADYTQKTQAAAKLAKEAEERLAWAKSPIAQQVQQFLDRYNKDPAWAARFKGTFEAMDLPQDAEQREVFSRLKTEILGTIEERLEKQRLDSIRQNTEAELAQVAIERGVDPEFLLFKARKLILANEAPERTPRELAERVAADIRRAQGLQPQQQPAATQQNQNSDPQSSPPRTVPGGAPGGTGQVPPVPTFKNKSEMNKGVLAYLRGLKG